MFQDTSIPVVTMDYMNRKQAIDFLKRILYLERKSEHVKGLDLDTHKIIDMWERINFIDNEAF